jgi:gamma-glutamyltranspeptidase/glutathione hydrolase
MTRGATRGVVAAGHAETCRAATAALEAGGNAFDAAVAAGFASAVCEPALTSLGGGGFLLARPAEGRPVLFDFFADTPGRALPPGDLEPHFLPVTVRFPASEQVFNVGLGSCAVPGALRGYLHVHGRLGRLPLREVLAPAVRLAREGVRLNARQAYFLSLLRPILTLTDGGRALFAPEGAVPVEGERLRNPALADFLEALPTDGDRALHEGSIAARIDRDMREGGGLLTRADLAAYHVVEREPLSVDYRGHRLLTNPAPSFGGSLLALSLRLLEETGAPPAQADAPARFTALLAVMREVDRLRARGCLSPDDLARLSEAERGALRARVRRSSGGTTHVSVCDALGNAASMTTSNGEGSGYVVPGTGIHLNNMMGEDDLHPDGFHASPPGQRVASMMSPCLLLRDGDLHAVLGSGGSKRIRTALLQVVSDRVDHGLALDDAVERPRIHWDGETLHAEPGLGPEVLAALAARAPVRSWDRLDLYFGGVHAVAPGGEAAGDPRRGGAVARVGMD